MVNTLAGGVAMAVMGGAEAIPHIVHNVDTGGRTTPSARPP